jgi:hypothetical protein
MSAKADMDGSVAPLNSLCGCFKYILSNPAPLCFFSFQRVDIPLMRPDGPWLVPNGPCLVPDGIRLSSKDYIVEMCILHSSCLKCIEASRTVRR